MTLSLVNKKLLSIYESYKETPYTTRREDILRKKLISAIELFLVFHTQSSEYGVIFQIENNSLNLSYIPRSVKDSIA